MKHIIWISSLLVLVGLGYIGAASASHNGPDFWMHCTSIPVVCQEQPVPTVTETTTVTVTGPSPSATVQQAVDATPNGGIVQLENRTYTEGTVNVTGRSNLTIDGNGATVQGAVGDGHQPVFRVTGGSGVTFREFTLDGGYANGGTHDPPVQWSHGIELLGAANITVTGLTIRDVAGDCVYAGKNETTNARSSNVDVFATTCVGTGRNGVAAVAVNDLLVSGGSYGTVGYNVFDVEPNATANSGVNGVVFTQATVGNYAASPGVALGVFVPGAAQADNVTFSNLNVTASLGAVARVGGPGTARRLNYTYTGITSTNPAWNTTAIGVVNVDGLTVTNNTIPSTTLLGCTSVTGLTFTGNTPSTTAGCVPPPPPPSSCTDTLAAGGDLSSFLGTLTTGDVGCLHGGDYTDGNTLTWSGSGATLTSFPGETARVHTELHLTGSNATLQGFTISNTQTTCNAGASTTGCDGVRISGSGDRLLDMVIENTDRHGVLFHSSSSNGQILRSIIHDTGQDGTNLEHGIYFQGSGHLVANNIISLQHGGYGIQLYPSSSNVTLVHNTVADTLTRPSIVINTSGSGNKVVNNVFEDGVNMGSCSGCTINTNLTSNPGFIDSLYRVGPSSPAVDAANTAFVVSPAWGGVVRPQGAGPDIGAHER